MSEHLSTSEIIEVCSAKAVNPSFLALAARVNSHIMTCEECREAYQAFLEAGEAIDKMGAEQVPAQPVEPQLLKVQDRIKEQLQEAGLSITKFVKGWSGLGLKIQSLRSMECELFDTLTQLYHPTYAAVAKSLGHTAPSRAFQPPVIKSTLTDGRGSRLSVGEDGSLSFFLASGEADTNTIVALAPDNDDDVIYFKFLRPYDALTLTAQFEDISPGNYYAAVVKVSAKAI